MDFNSVEDHHRATIGQETDGHPPQFRPGTELIDAVTLRAHGLSHEDVQLRTWLLHIRVVGWCVDLRVVFLFSFLAVPLYVHVHHDDGIELQDWK